MRSQLTIEQKIEEIYAIWMKTGKIPTLLDSASFSNGQDIGFWLLGNDNRDNIIEQASLGNYKAIRIVKDNKWNTEDIDIKYTVDVRISEVYDEWLKTGKLPDWKDNVKFSNGTDMGTWLHQKESRNAIIKEAIVDSSEEYSESDYNYKAIRIVRESGWDISSIEDYTEDIILPINLDIRINEIYDIWVQRGSLPKNEENIKFSNGTDMGFWLMIRNNRDILKEQGELGNIKALEIVEEYERQKLITKQIYENAKAEYENSSIFGKIIYKIKNRKKRGKIM